MNALIRPVLAIARRELRALWLTPTGGLMAAAFWLVSGAFFLVLVQGYTLRAMQTPLQTFGGPQLQVHTHLIAPWFGNTGLVMMLLGPLVAMRGLADETRLETLPLLLSAPVSPAQIVIGKFLGAWAFTLLIVAGTGWIPAWTAQFGHVPLAPTLTGYLALLLLAADVVAIGVLASALTTQPAAAALLGASIALMLWVLGLIDPDPTSLLSRASLSAHVRDLFFGLIRLSDLVYLVGLSAASLGLATWRLSWWDPS